MIYFDKLYSDYIHGFDNRDIPKNTVNKKRLGATLFVAEYEFFHD